MAGCETRRQDPAAAKEQIADIARVARQALADVRADRVRIRRSGSPRDRQRALGAARGRHRGPPADGHELSEEVSELFGYVVREAVTNVVRHSEAAWCTIEVDSRRSRSPTTGVGPARPGRPGLNGLDKRVATAGGTLESRCPGADDDHRRRGGAVGRSERTMEIGSAGLEAAMIRVLVADDQAMIPEALAALLRTEPDLEVVALAPPAPESVRRAPEVEPDVVLMDVQMPGPADCRTALRPPRRSWPPDRRRR